MDLKFDTNKKKANDQKLRGGYYTPLRLAQYLAQWGIRTGRERILEPSCGDGNFLIAAAQLCQSRQLPRPHITAIEIEPGEIEIAQERVRNTTDVFQNVTWVCGDFFESYGHLQTEEQFDLVLGNPPFIRFQYFDDSVRERAFGYLREADYSPTKLANAWAAFVQLSIERLGVGGRLAMVVPAELLQVNYARELRSRLSRAFDHIILIGFRKLVFAEIQQEVLLLLAEGKRGELGNLSDIHTIEFEDGEELLRTTNLTHTIAHLPVKHTRNGMKWTALFLKNNHYEALDQAEQVRELVRLGDIASVDVGVVTGRNSFFVLTRELRDQLDASDSTIPIISRTAGLPSIIFRQPDFIKFSNGGQAFLLTLAGRSLDDLPQALKSYLDNGEKEKVNEGYKCRIRPNWWAVPSVYVPDAFLFRQIHRYPLLVVNEVGATSTDTIHRVRFLTEVNGRLLAATMFNSLTLAWAEVCGRSYGGGVLELEPREAEELPVPYHSELEIDVEQVDRLIRGGNETDALNYVDGIVLRDYLGFTELQIQQIRGAWIELRDRRIYRR